MDTSKINLCTTDDMKFIDSSELIIGKWYVTLEIDARREESVIAGPFESLLDAEEYSLPGELIPSQFGVFKFEINGAVD